MVLAIARRLLLLRRVAAGGVHAAGISLISRCLTEVKADQDKV
jgi:hypothetical protein